MKKILLAVLELLTINLAHAAKYCVTTSQFISADFLSFQAAHEPTGKGGAIYVEGSLMLYNNNGEVNITKPRLIIDPGYFLGEDLLTQAKLKKAKFKQIIFSVGSESNILTGLVQNRMEVNISDSNLKRNNVGSLNFNSNNFILAQNVISSHIDGHNCKGLVSINNIPNAAFIDLTLITNLERRGTNAADFVIATLSGSKLSPWKKVIGLFPNSITGLFSPTATSGLLPNV